MSLIIKSMDTGMVILIACASFVAIAAIVFMVLFFSNRKRQRETAHRKEAETIRIKDGVRYTVDKNINGPNGEVKVSHTEGDLILDRGKEYTVRRGGMIMPGKYTVLSTSGDRKFNIRISGLLREYSHADGIILSEGDKICATSHSIVLR